MDCKTAKQLLDQRVHQTPAQPGGKTESTDPPGGSALDAHLADCPNCAADLADLLTTARLLSSLSDDAPTPEEIETMWTALQTAAAGTGTPTAAVSPKMSWPGARLTGAIRRFLDQRRRIAPYVGGTLGTAALLLIALTVGDMRFSEHPVITSGFVLSNLRGLGSSSAVYESAAFAPSFVVYNADGVDEIRSSEVQRRFTKPFFNTPSRDQAVVAGKEPQPADGAFRFDSYFAAGDDVSGGLFGIPPRLDALGKPSAAGQLWNLAYMASVSGDPFISPSMSPADRSAAPVAEQALAEATAESRFKDVDSVSYDDSLARKASEQIPDEVFEKLASLGYVSAEPRRTHRKARKKAGKSQASFGENFLRGKVTARMTRKTPPSPELSSGRGGRRGRPTGGGAGRDSIFGDDDFEPDYVRSAPLSGVAAEKMPLDPEQLAALTAILDARRTLLGVYDGGEGAASGDAGQFADPFPAAQEHALYSLGVVPEQSAATGAGTPPEPVKQPSRKTPPQAGPIAEQGPDDGVAPVTTALPRPQPKIIKTGEVEMEVPDYVEAVASARAMVREAGAYVADVWSQEQTGGAMFGRLTIRVVPEHFEALFAALKTLGRIETENVKAADVTAKYVDVEARIAAKRATEESLKKILAGKSFIDRVKDLLEIEREMARVRGEIEQLQGQLRVMADRIGLSTIAVTLREAARTVPSATLSVEVPTLAAAGAALGEAVADLGGRLLSGKTSKRDDGTLQGEYQLQVTLARFGELLGILEHLGRVEQRQVSDRQFDQATAPWAKRINCAIALVLYERSRQLPTGQITIEVEAVANALDRLEGPVADAQAAIVENRSTRRDDGTNEAALKIRVPAGKFAELVGALDVLGRITGKQVAGEAGQIVGGAANVMCDLSLTLAERPREIPSGHMAIEVSTFETARKLLSDLIAEKNVQVLGSSSNQRTDGTWVGGFRLGIKAADMEAVVSRLESLGRVVSRQIVGLGLGDLSRADPNALGVIEVALGEKSAITPGPDRAGDSLRSRLRDGLAGLYSSLGLILYGLVVIAPWVVIVGVAAWVITRLRHKRAQEPQPAEAKA